MNMTIIGRNRLVHRRHIVYVHKQVMVASALTFHARWRHTQPIQTESHGDWRTHGLPISWRNKIHRRAFRSGCRSMDPGNH